MSVSPESVVRSVRFNEDQRRRVHEARIARARTAQEKLIEEQVRMIEADVRGLRAILDAEDRAKDKDDAPSVSDAH